MRTTRWILTVAFVLTLAGRYELCCDIGLHRSLAMEGVVLAR